MKKHTGQIQTIGDGGADPPKLSALPAKRKRGRKLLLLEPEVKRTILGFIGAGAFAWTAAAAAGVGNSTYFRWMDIGAKHDAEGRKSVYREFWVEVQQASGQARVRNEIKVAQANPEFWLRNGPGKSRPGREGWTEIVEVRTPEGGEFKIMQKLEIGQLGRVMDILADAGAIPPLTSDDPHDGVGQGERIAPSVPHPPDPAPPPDDPQSEDPSDQRRAARARELREGVRPPPGQTPF